MIPELLLVILGVLASISGWLKAATVRVADAKKFSSYSGQHGCWTDHLPH